jgi:hypothetical protein
MQTLPLTSIGINGFRGLRSLRLDGVGHVNILVGGNNSGKTSVLEAISLICQPYNPEEWLSMIRRRDFGGLDETRLQSLRWSFTQQGSLADPEMMLEADCEFECSGRFPLNTLRVRYREFIGEPAPEERRRSQGAYRSSEPDIEEPMRGGELSYFPDWKSGDKLDLFSGRPYDGMESLLILRLWEGLMTPRFARPRRGPRLNTETLTPYSYQLNRVQARSYSSQISRGNLSHAIELLRDFDPEVEGLELASIYGDRPAIYIKHKKLGFAPLSIFGDAMRRSVLLAATLPSLKGGGVLLIDEVEVGIHVGALRRVFKWLVDSAKELNVQVFVTTHSLEALDALLSARDESENEGIVAFHLAQSAEGTDCKRYSGDLLQRLRFERGLDVR